MSLITHFQKAKRAAIVKSMLKARYTPIEKMKRKLKDLYATVEINELQKEEINKMRMEWAAKQREMGAKYMKIEIDIITDLAGKYQPKIVDSKGQIIK